VQFFGKCGKRCRSTLRTSRLSWKIALFRQCTGRKSMRTYCRENEPFANITQSFIVFNATDRHPFNTESLSQAKLFMEAISVSWELHRRHFHPAKIKSTRIVATPGVSGNAYVGYADVTPFHTQTTGNSSV
jgi:hypothetical protein